MRCRPQLPNRHYGRWRRSGVNSIWYLPDRYMVGICSSLKSWLLDYDGRFPLLFKWLGYLCNSVVGVWGFTEPRDGKRLHLHLPTAWHKWRSYISPSVSHLMMIIRVLPVEWTWSMQKRWHYLLCMRDFDFELDAGGMFLSGFVLGFISGSPPLFLS